ncbi:WxL domain-containing protein [Enterococcus sp. AZ109]|uniref:WxL domain-containing protein n=1 Tax=Enterococcus sp. AZ109 TaxID=2774634 RepID=UPI003F1EE00C
MKKTTVALTCLVLASVTLGGVSAFAADGKPSTGRVAFTSGGTEGNEGLYIERVSDLDFGSNPIATTNQSYTTASNGFEVVDISGKAAGWNLQVKQGAQFTGADASVLTGAELSLTGISAGSGPGTAPGTAAPSVEFATMDQNYLVVSAAANQGKGAWSYDHGGKLDVPATAVPNSVQYTTTLTWSLVSGPAS